MSTPRRKLVERASPFVLMAIIALLWELVCRVFEVSEFVFPAPSAISKAASASPPSDRSVQARISPRCARTNSPCARSAARSASYFATGVDT